VFSRFSRYKERNRTRDFIKRAKANVERVETDAKAAREDLTKHLQNGADPSSFAMVMLRDCVEFMEQNAANMRASHERFVERSARPSPAYPFGIALEQ
jgi:hypothetical protein